MGTETEEQLKKFERDLGYTFASRDLLVHALRHSSSTASKDENNERLEFFGDAVLDFIICEELFQRCPDCDEGSMTDIKGEIVSRKVIGRVLKKLGAREVMFLGKGISSNKNLPISLYANMFEAIVAAVYLDGGMESARVIVLRLLEEEIALAIKTAKKLNYKSSVQELVQKYKLGELLYTITGTSGPEHEKIFNVKLELNGVELGRGTGRNRKLAEQAAAEEAYKSQILSEQLKPEG